jgi:hypothetical protein
VELFLGFGLLIFATFMVLSEKTVKLRRFRRFLKPVLFIGWLIALLVGAGILSEIKDSIVASSNDPKAVFWYVGGMYGTFTALMSFLVRKIWQIKAPAAAVEQVPVVRHQTPTEQVTIPLQPSTSISTSNISLKPSQWSGMNIIGQSANANNTNILSVDKNLSPMSITTDELTEENHWATAMNELESGQRRTGVWAKAFAESDGDEIQTKVAYLKARVQQLTEFQKEQFKQQEVHRQELATKAQAANSERRKVIDALIVQFESTGFITLTEIKMLVSNAPNNDRIIGITDQKGNSLLHICAESDLAEEVHALLQVGADPQRLNKKGQRPEFMTKNNIVREVLARLSMTSEQLRSLLYPVNGRCPNTRCNFVIPMASLECPKCGTFFRVGSAWSVLPLAKS